VLATYAAAQLEQGRIERAKALADSALIVAEGNKSADNFSAYVEALSILAETYFKSGDLDFADSLVSTAIQIDPAEYDLLHLRATIQSGLGNSIRAGELADSAIVVLERSSGAIVPMERASLYVTRAIIYGKQGSLGAEDSLFALVKQICDSSVDSEYKNRRFEALEQYAQYLRRRRRYGDALVQLDTLIEQRARYLDKAPIGELTESEIRRLSEVLRHSVDLLFSVVLDSRDNLDLHKEAIVNSILLAKGITTESIFLRNRRQVSSALKFAKDRRTQLHDLDEVAVDVSMLLEYYKYAYVNLANDSCEERYIAYSIAPGSYSNVCHVYDIGLAFEVDSLIDRFTDNIRGVVASGVFPGSLQTDSLSESSEALYGKVVQDILPKRSNIHLLVVSPDDKLNQIPFGALRTESGEYLIERLPIQYLVSGRDVAHHMESPPNDNRMLIIANPELDYLLQDRHPTNTTTPLYDNSCIDLKRLAQTKLPGTEREANAINSNTSIPSDVLLGVSASKTSFESAAQTGKYRIIHIATHGYYAPSDCPGVEVPPDSNMAASFSRAGLLLARSSNDSTGVVTANEIASLDLSGVKLVTLSACESGGGVVVSGDGVYGMRKAFFLAGVKNVVSALWNVDDESSKRFMLSLYNKPAHVIPRRLREIKVEQIRSLRERGDPDHPFTWGAAFVSYGDWR